ncbi:MAG: winged helix-turn-helix domain-containing protein [Sulfitobacter sp.]
MRLSEDVTVTRAILWGPDGRLSYPTPNGFTPLPYEFSDDERRRLASRYSEVTAPTWERFDAMGLELLQCRSAPAICLIYDRAALEGLFGLKNGALLTGNRSSLGRSMLLMLAAVLGGTAFWVSRPSRRGSSEFTLMPERHSAMRGTLEIPLSARDLRVLSLLEARDGAVATKDELYDAGWGRDFMPNSRALDQHMINLRRKLDPDKTLPILIETVHGTGYRLVK